MLNDSTFRFAPFAASLTIEDTCSMALFNKSFQKLLVKISFPNLLFSEFAENLSSYCNFFLNFIGATVLRPLSLKSMQFRYVVA